MGCKRIYKASRFARERELADTARMLGLANPGWRETFADAVPGQCELMLLRAAAHRLQYADLRATLCRSMPCMTISTT